MKLITISILMGFAIFAAFSGKYVRTQETWPENFRSINYLEYYLEFSPNSINYSNTGYTLNIERINESTITVNTGFRDASLTLFEIDYGYNISLDSYTILNTTYSNYRLKMIGYKTELFLNLSNLGNPQTFRVDETITYGPFLETTAEDGDKIIETEFTYAGIEQLETNFTTDFNLTTHKYSAEFSWLGPGCT
jgi:hypothetical protein